MITYTSCQYWKIIQFLSLSYVHGIYFWSAITSFLAQTCFVTIWHDLQNRIVLILFLRWSEIINDCADCELDLHCYLNYTEILEQVVVLRYCQANEENWQPPSCYTHFKLWSALSLFFLYLVLRMSDTSDKQLNELESSDIIHDFAKDPFHRIL